MNKDVKKQWVEALQSGLYSRTTHQLRKVKPAGSDEFCPLGVLCDLYSKATGIPWGPDGTYLSNDARLPVEVSNWAGFKVSPFEMPGFGPKLTPAHHGNMTIPTLNDNWNFSFQEVAKLIEEQL